MSPDDVPDAHRKYGRIGEDVVGLGRRQHLDGDRGVAEIEAGGVRAGVPGPNGENEADATSKATFSGATSGAEVPRAIDRTYLVVGRPPRALSEDSGDAAVRLPASRPAYPSVAPSVPTPEAVVPQPEPPRGPPGFDRSAKPKETTFDTRVMGGASQTDVQVVPSREVPHVPSLPVAPARPRVDRSTKEAVARKEAEFQRNLFAVYEACTQDFRNMT
ncbi:hypothetical protein L596_027110 [Steinernema carpocapsae]|uniref:Uncharacterized protein n=1 Tax=Steinernema carpocapsae TaxID=34508 RepID=A0A4U5M3D3_STECR|nr:hypothetical protein L596_027110 [Steinernema carpocapsae]